MAPYDPEEKPEAAGSDEAMFGFKNYEPKLEAARLQYRLRQKMPDWAIKEDFVISGMAGRFPESDSVREYEYNLYNNIDMVVEDERRWPFGYLGLPKGSGKLRDISRFDNRFFNVNDKDANYMDSQVRIMLEITFEALWDAGLDPASLAGTNTGVFLGNCFDEALSAYAEDYTRIPDYKQCFFAMLGNVYDFRGPSKHFDTACASGFSALHEAMVSLRSGECERAIVVGLNLCLRAATQNQFLNLNMISPDGHCKCLDDDANGYAKGEACVAVVIQRKPEAKRIYATVVHTKTNCDGYKDLGITYPSFELQRELIEDTYREVNMDPNEVGFCEGHCTGTQAGDPSEMRAIRESMCKDRKEPLLIGAVKSVIGHTEASSGLCGLVKALLSFEHEMIPANLHMNKINHRIEGLVSGILKPVIVNTPYTGKYIALNCFGFGGMNVHAIMRKHESSASETKSVAEQLPRLVTFCGRNVATLEQILAFIRNNPNRVSAEYLALLNDISKTSPFPSRMFKGMRHRAFAILDKDTRAVQEDMKSAKIRDKEQPPVCFVFTGMGCQWANMGKELSQFEVVKTALDLCAKTVQNIDANFDLTKVLTEESGEALKSPLNSFVAIAAIQIALVELLKQMGISGQYFVGHSIGELLCAYADGCLSLEETVACAYWRGKCIELTRKTEGAMAAVACTWQEATAWCSELSDGQVWPACHNSIDSVTVSGNKDNVESFLTKLQQRNEDIFARQVNSSGVAFHSPLLKDIHSPLLEQLTKVFADKPLRQRTSRWISSTYEENADCNRQFNVNYLVDNLIQPVRFYSSLAQVPSSAIFLEIGPHHLLQTIVKRTLMSEVQNGAVKYVASLSRQKSNIESILQMLGHLYINGLNPNVELLYPRVQYPVPRGTPPLHSIIQWKHDRQFTVTQYPDFYNQTKLYESARTIDLQHKDDMHLADHCIDGRILFPATGYLHLAWTHVAKVLKVDFRELPIIFEDVSLHRATIMPKNDITNFDVFFQDQTGHFYITEGGTLTTSGKIRLPGTDSIDPLKHQQLLDKIQSLEGQSYQMEMNGKDVYKEFRLRGYDYGPEFQAVQYIRQVDTCLLAKVAFKDWVTFVDGLIQLAVLGQPMRGLFLPVRFTSLRCDPRKLYAAIGDQKEVKVFDAIFDGVLNVGVAPGIEYQGIKANLAPRKNNQQPVEETFEFVPFNELDLPYMASRAVSKARSTSMTEQLSQYQDICLRLMSGDKIDAEEKKQFELKFEHDVASPVLMRLIEQFVSTTDKTAFNEKTFDKLEEDLLFRTYFTERFLRSQLETFCENLLDTAAQILEVNQTPTILANNVFKWLALSSFKVNYIYRLLHSALNKFDSMNVDATHSQHDWLAEKSKFPTDIANLDLIIYKDSSVCPLLSQHTVNFSHLLDSMWGALKERGFVLIILRDRPFPAELKLAQLLGKELMSGASSRVQQLEDALSKTSFGIVSHKSDQFGAHAYFVRKLNPVLIEEQYFLPITNDTKQWFGELQDKIRELAKNEQERGNIWLLANDATNGVIGLISCLHKEPLGGRVRCILNFDRNVSLDASSDLVRDIVKLDLFSNAIGPSGVTGNFRHFTLPAEHREPIPVEHCFLNVTTRGDLSSLRWFESQHKHWPLNRKHNQQLCTVYYSSLNFRDIMLATGKLPPDALPDNMGLDDCLLGFEFSGRDENGNRVMGIGLSKALATTIVIDKNLEKFLWPIPANWSMEEAATVPVAYATAYYALIIRGKLRPYEKVLIHSGSGAVGQAAIAICLSLDCQLFITVGSDTKRDILMQLFPQLKSNQFASSRNTEFCKIILQATDGKGVDVVLNSLAEEKLLASVECLGEFGRFLEIGKYDLSLNNPLNISSVMKNKIFHGILLDNLFSFSPNNPPSLDRHRDLIWELMKDGIKKGVVRPLERTIFAVNQCEEAFRYMATGKHIGKVVICIRPEEQPDARGLIKIDTEHKLLATPRTVFFSDKSYIITGGLGGFGLELINWMIEREARKFIITSRTGVKDLYQKTRLDVFEKAGAYVKIFTGNAALASDAEQLVEEAEKLGPLGGVFHLAMVLSDGLFDNQTLDSFEAVVKPKAEAFANLDNITRVRCPSVDYFVAFSSVSCGCGNPGQTNYGFANSVMERICEQRRRDGKHGFAIQWGAIGDVGYIIDNVRGNEVIICGSVPQRIPSCLAALDSLLQAPYAVCSNLIKTDYKFEGACGKASLIKTVAHILGVKEYENLEPNLTLGELGMDSLMGVEVKQAIERDYEVVLSMQDVRKLTIGRIIEIGAGDQKRSGESSQQANAADSIDATLVPASAFSYLNDIYNGEPIIFLPQLDATYEEILPIAAKINRPAIGLNWTKECKNLLTIPDVARHYIEIIEKNLPNLENNYDVIGYSFGGIVAIEMAIQLHQRKTGKLGPCRKLILLDSSPKQFKIYTEQAVLKYNIQDKHNDHALLETILLFLLSKLAIDYNKIKEILLSLENTSKRISFVRDLFKQMQNLDIQEETLEFLIQSHYNKMLMMNLYECPEKALPGDLMLVRASEFLVNAKNAEDYWLGEITSGKCHLHVLKGDHKTFITDNYSEIAELIRKYLEQ